MKIKLYPLGWRTRHGSDGVDIYYSERARLESLLDWLDGGAVGEDADELYDLMEAGKYDRAWQRFGEMIADKGHEFYVGEATVIDVEKAEKIN